MVSHSDVFDTYNGYMVVYNPSQQGPANRYQSAIDLVSNRGSLLSGASLLY